MRTVELEEGGQYTCTLPGKASAGYIWVHTVEGAPNVINIVEASVSSPHSERESGPPPAGYSADVQFTITAVAPGDITIRFQLRRPWETNKPPLDERMLHVIVSSRETR
ncbi:MAG: protease inhibitor I42 family protein [Halobacteriota archaeon]